MANSKDTEEAGRLYFAALESRTVGDLSRAEALCRKSVELAPEKLSSRVVLGEILLARGNYIEGFEYYDSWPNLRAALGQGEIPNMPFPRWQGEDLAGKSLLVLPLQGFGDQIQYARFFNKLASLGCSLSVVAPPELCDLFQIFDADIIPSDIGARIQTHDYWTYPISIPRWLKTTRESVSGEPYLRQTKSIGEKIGLVWRGNPAHPNDVNRSARREDFSSLYENFECIELDIDYTGARSFSETIEIIANCKAIVSVDTSIVHLSGAIGFPCHLLLPSTNPDWRWMQDSKTPWYDSITIYRQHSPGNWEMPIRGVVSSLRK